MKKTAVAGVIGSGRISQCVECRALGVADGVQCNGFGPGCFLPHARRPAGAGSSDERVAFHPELLPLARRLLDANLVARLGNRMARRRGARPHS